jgi:hypothetical protein
MKDPIDEIVCWPMHASPLLFNFAGEMHGNRYVT